MKSAVGILSASCQLPKTKHAVENLFRDEEAHYSPEIAARLGIEQVHLQNGAASETASNMAVAAGREALQRAKVDPQTVNVVVEYSIMPQEYLVPVWNMSNKVQAEVGATKSFVVGFSGGGSSNFMVALSSAAAMLSENEALKTALAGYRRYHHSRQPRAQPVRSRHGNGGRSQRGCPATRLAHVV